jgi:ribosomal protein L14E/L6E/L27E
MKEMEAGGYAVSKAGHDFGKKYVIFEIRDEYVYLVDGIIRKTDHPKKKKAMHITLLGKRDSALSEKVRNRTVKNEEIKRALKLLQEN